MSLVVDVGSYSTKFGAAGQETPTEFRTCLYTAQYPSSIYASLTSLMEKQIQPVNKEQFLLSPEYCGLYRQREIFQDNGKLGNIEDIYKLLGFIFEQFKQSINRLTLILPPLVSERQQRQIQEFAFDKMNVEHLHMSTGGAFALYTSNRVEGVVVNIGDTTSFAQPILNNMTTEIEVTSRGGRMVTKRMLDHVYQINNNVLGFDIEAFGNKEYDLELAYLIKHEVSDVQTLQYSRSREKSTEVVRYALEAQQTTLSMQKWQIHDAFEFLFDEFANSEPTIVQIITNAVSSVPKNLQQKLLKNVVVVGGGSCANKICNRILEELKQHYQDNYEVEVYGVKGRNHSMYRGAATCCMLGSFEGYYVTKNDIE